MSPAGIGGFREVGPSKQIRPGLISTQLRLQVPEAFRRFIVPGTMKSVLDEVGQVALSRHRIALAGSISAYNVTFHSHNPQDLKDHFVQWYTNYVQAASVLEIRSEAGYDNSAALSARVAMPHFDPHEEFDLSVPREQTSINFDIRLDSDTYAKPKEILADLKARLSATLAVMEQVSGGSMKLEVLVAGKSRYLFISLPFLGNDGNPNPTVVDMQEAALNHALSHGIELGGGPRQDAAAVLYSF